ncbi:putative acyl-coenzyme A oxidase 3.2, peroxisomal [Acorus calamus]|uniref:Acyl-coenzyme A oxidase 3.2, peroxisomal n=1 Tax=Acorus calamus TaxID=4465 RepID=A0AAV9FF06_ACOCL|nr:putative acyl-coenzyme A oxidase 3.2, peroxisomal [Acorus calamus]
MLDTDPQCSPLVKHLETINLLILPPSQECHEACGGQGLKTENHVGSLISEFDISKALLGEYLAVQSCKRPYKGL